MSGPVAQLGARLHGMQKVRGSNPLRSTRACPQLGARCFLRAGYRFVRRLSAVGSPQRAERRHEALDIRFGVVVVGRHAQELPAHADIHLLGRQTRGEVWLQRTRRTDSQQVDAIQEGDLSGKAAWRAECAIGLPGTRSPFI